MLAASLTHTMVSSLPGCVDRLLSLLFFPTVAHPRRTSLQGKEKRRAPFVIRPHAAWRLQRSLQATRKQVSARGTPVAWMEGLLIPPPPISSAFTMAPLFKKKWKNRVYLATISQKPCFFPPLMKIAGRTFPHSLAGQLDFHFPARLWKMLTCSSYLSEPAVT